jgi:hypothetical protein
MELILEHTDDEIKPLTDKEIFQEKKIKKKKETTGRQPIDRYFKSTDDDDKTFRIDYPNYFIWKNENELPYFTNEITDDIRIVSDTAWKETQKTLYIGASLSIRQKFITKTNELSKYQEELMTYIELTPSPDKKVTEKDQLIKVINLLKSNMQKAIRRQDANKALKSAFGLCVLDQQQLVRRLPICMIEDVYTNKQLLTLVWLMVAVSKSGYLTKHAVSWLLGVVNDLCLNDKRETIMTDLTGSQNIQFLNVLKSKHTNSNLEELITKNKIDVLWAYQLRKSFGGLGGDQRMLDYYTLLWLDRIMHKTQRLANRVIELVEINDELLPHKDDILIESVDFHCTNIDFKICQKFTNYDAEEVRGAIWHYRSKINNRESINGVMSDKESIEEMKYKTVWNNIKDYTDKWAAKYIALMIKA